VSIRLRMTLTYWLALVFVLASVAVLVWVQLGRDLRGSLDAALQVQATDVRAGYETDTHVSLAVRDPGRPGIFTIIYDRAGAVVRTSQDAPVLAAVPPVGVSEALADGRRYALYGEAGPDGVRVVAGSSLGEVDRALDGLATLLLGVGLAAGIVVLAALWWLSGLMLRPMATMGRELAAIGPSDLGQRVSQAAKPDEVGRLAGAINAMLGRIDDGLRRQTAFVAAASHDLRTPIATLRAELELAERGPNEPGALLGAIRGAHADAVRLGNLANDLLALAEAEPGGRVLLRSTVATHELVETCVADQSALAEQRGVTVEAHAPDGVVSVDRTRIEQALRNLLANAIRFGPPGSTVEVIAEIDRLSPGGGGGPAAGARTLRLTVADRGPGVAAERRPSLFMPFAAGADADHPGLGLAVAAAAVRAHGGSIAYADRPGGGAEFRVIVPA
jgi:two-component system OmpR family sensor kinase